MNLVAKAKSAVRWATGLTLVTQVAMWAITIIIVRILSPEDYGLMAMSMVMVGFAMIVNEVGLGSALVQKPDLSEIEIRAAQGFVLLLNVALYSIFFVCAPWISAFFDEPALVSMIRTIALLFPILSLEVVALAILERNLDFKKKASMYMFANVSGVLVSLILAIMGAGVWSLIFGNLWAAVAKTIGINVSIRRLIVPSMQLSAVKPMLGFGGIVAAERVLWYVHSQADVFLIGKLLGKEQLGYYYVALNLASIVYHKTGGLIYEVSLPTFANAQTDIDDVRRFFVRAMRVIGFIVFPLMFGFAAVSTDAVELLLGEKWAAAAILVLILSLSMPARIMGNLLPPALQGVGQPNKSLSNLLYAVAIMVPALLVAAIFDVEKVAISWLAIYPLVLIIMYARSRGILGLDWKDARSAVLPPFLGSLIMFGLVSWLGSGFTHSTMPLIARLALSIAAGIAIYGVISVLGMRRQMAEFFSLIRK